MQVARMPSAVVLGGTRPDRGGCPPEFRRRLVLQSWSHSDGPALPRVPAGFSPAFWRMARPIITVHGVHSNDEETRLGALSDDVRFDVLQGSWLHDALSLNRYPNNPLAPQYTARLGTTVNCTVLLSMDSHRFTIQQLQLAHDRGQLIAS